MSSEASAPMPVLGVRKAQTAHPTGDPKFEVQQAFPHPVSAEEADPFLMLDHFGPEVSKGRIEDPDEFPVGWHPHKGQDVLTYLIEGVGRHADSLGNRGEFTAPGLQWMATGSGVEHAEGGGTPAGQRMEGFQIWVNVPSARKMEDPRYGTVPTEELPVIDDVSPGVRVRLLAGDIGSVHGPFETVQPVQIADYVLAGSSSHSHSSPLGFETALVYCYLGGGTVNGKRIAKNNIAILDGRSDAARLIELVSGEAGLSVLVFTGKRLNQPIAWHGPFVMTTDDEIRATIAAVRRGAFPPKRSAWDYKRIATAPRK